MARRIAINAEPQNMPLNKLICGLVLFSVWFLIQSERKLNP